MNNQAPSRRPLSPLNHSISLRSTLTAPFESREKEQQNTQTWIERLEEGRKSRGGGYCCQLTYVLLVALPVTGRALWARRGLITAGRNVGRLPALTRAPQKPRRTAAWNPAFFARARPDTPRETRLLVPRGRAAPLLSLSLSVSISSRRGSFVQQRGQLSEGACCYFTRDVIHRHDGLFHPDSTVWNSCTRETPREKE